jgi:hypothetical protein
MQKISPFSWELSKKIRKCYEIHINCIEYKFKTHKSPNHISTCDQSIKTNQK